MSNRYRPNLVARSLAKGRGYVLALLLTDIASPFYAELSRDVEKIAQAHGYRLLVCDTTYNVGTGRVSAQAQPCLVWQGAGAPGRCAWGWQR